MSYLPEEQQFAAYASAFRSLRVSRSASGPFETRARIWHVGSLIISHVHTDPARFERTEDLLRSDPTDHFVATCLLKGAFISDHGDGPMRVPKGSVSFVDVRRTFWNEDSRQEMIAGTARETVRGLPAFAGSDSLLDIVRAYIDAHLTDPLDIDTLCDALGLTPGAFRRDAPPPSPVGAASDRSAPDTFRSWTRRLD